jgi:glycosyltransferase involved in cell wall biosynthesis
MKYIFVAPIATEGYNQKNGVAFHVAAATNKVLGLAAAVRSQGRHAEVVSVPISTSMAQLSLPGMEQTSQGVPITFLRTISVRGLNRVWAGLTLTWHLVRRASERDAIILYNFFPEYLLPALVQRLRGNPCILDIEDAPRCDEHGLRGRVNRLSFNLLRRWTSDRYLVASGAIGKQLELTRFKPVYGARSEEPTKSILNEHTVNVLFGGALLRETGVELFCSALRKLAESEEATRLHFIVTGFGETQAIKRTIRDLQARISAEVHFDVPPAIFREKLLSADVALSLKLPSTSIGATTFPSKVVEISSGGTLLVTTNVADIGDLFSPNDALILEGEDPQCLVDALKDIVNRRTWYREVAARGQAVARERFSLEGVGRSVRDFLEAPHAQY